MHKGLASKKKHLASKGKDNHNLSPVEHEVMYLANVEGLTISQIATRRGTSRQAVEQALGRARKKGARYPSIFGPCILPPPVSKCKVRNHKEVVKQWRYHALHFVIKPYYFFPRYEKICKEKGNYGINYREWVIKLHPTIVEIQLQSLEDFADPDKWQATRKAEESFNRTLREVSERYGFAVWKDKKVNIKLVNQELAQNPSEVANARKGEYLTIRGEDGKIWFKIDKSKGAEHEYTHPRRALCDSEKIEPYFNDMLDNQPLNLSQITNTVSITQNQIQEIAKALLNTNMQLQSILTLITPQNKDGEETLTKETANYIG